MSGPIRPQVSLTRQQRRALERRTKKGSRPLSGGLAPAGAALVVGALAASQPAEAAVFNVTNLNDSGAGSLRQAIADANGAAGADTITFQAGLTGTIALTTGQLYITDSVDIQGPGAAVLTVSGSNSSRVFYLYSSAATIDVSISGLTVTGGNATIGGGIVDFDENLTLDGVTITQNTASGDGGGLWADGFSMTLNVLNCQISGNTAGDDGGGIYIEDTGGPWLIQNTVIDGNTATGSGGGIYFYDPDTDVTIERSTISGNSAGVIGGGVYLYSADAGTMTFRESTISGNDALAGGGAFFYGVDQPMVIENCTVSGNQATAGPGGGVYLASFNGSAEFRHTTIASNTAASTGGGLYLYGTTTMALEHLIVGDNTAAADNDLGGSGTFDTSFSLIESPGAANVNSITGNVLNQDPQLGALGNHGGPTQVQLPAFASPAVNAGDPAFAPPPSTDQRDAGFNRVVGGRIDMGAVELNPGTIQWSLATDSVAENVAGGTITITATRTGGSDGAVAVSYNTVDGSAMQPGDYAAAAGTLNWADGDSAPKSFNITIVNDANIEPDENFLVILSAPTNGANLGATTTEDVTITNDDTSIIAVPTLGEFGKYLLVGLLGAAGMIALRRKKGLAAPVVALTLTLGGAGAAEAARPPAETRAALVASSQQRGPELTLTLSDGSTIVVPASALEVKDRRKIHGARGAGSNAAALTASTPVIVKVRHNADGSIRKVKVQIFDSLQAAQVALQHKAGE